MSKQNSKRATQAHWGNAGLSLLFALVCVLGVSVFWVVTWKTPVWLQDDLLFATRSGNAYGETDLSSLWQGLMLDLFERNSRSADFFAQLFFSNSTLLGFWMAAIFVFFSAVLSWFFYSALPKNDWYLVVLGTTTSFGVLTPLVYPFFDASAFATYFFMSATVGYVLGFSWILLVIGWLRNVLVNRKTDLSIVKISFVAATSTLVAFHHEVLALLQLMLVIVLGMVSFKLKPGRNYWLVLGWVGLISILRFFTPGMWKRSEVYEWAFLDPQASAGTQYLSRLIYFLTYFLSHNQVLLIGTAVAFTYFYFQLTKHRILPAWMLSAHYLSLAGLASAIHLAQRLPESLYVGTLELNQYQEILFSKTALLMAAFALTSLTLQLLNLILAAFNLKTLAVSLTFALALAGFLVPFKLSFLSGRPLFYGLFFLLLSAILAFLQGWSLHCIKHPARGMLAVCLAVSCFLGIGVFEAKTVMPKMLANQKAWTQIVNQVATCKDGEQVVFPARLSYRELHSPFGDDGKQYLQHLRDYYAIPQGCQLVVGN
ncbi:hypothetical protein HMPREF0044_0812 [Gleimia coleocanis DSM 15436]|uniref:Uncharacterized protein n=1 Tax=Gleimia coleocanis DSM 15436 TaxID=525245 RepID=C0VZT4_9ACTO|nr:hypothetical protein [Gleimia coleocanis]EEH63793.1 hypothetical protein HMPREF0044_0812 [Gleimia coleocanis DSM 15436]